MKWLTLNTPNSSLNINVNHVRWFLVDDNSITIKFLIRTIVIKRKKDPTLYEEIGYILKGMVEGEIDDEIDGLQ